jgi:hypothetical protein
MPGRNAFGAENVIGKCNICTSRCIGQIPAELILLCLAVTLRTTRISIQKILLCNHMEFVCFVLISEQTASFTVHSIKRLVFITEVGSVYSAVRNESLYNTDTLSL